MAGNRRAGLTSCAACVAVSAYGGAVGLATGAIDLGGKLNGRLPFHSPVFGAIALAVIVGVPSSVLTRYARRGDERTDTIAVLAGVALIGWILVEIAFIRAFSWLQPFYGGIGATYVAVGRHAVTRPQPEEARS